MKRKSVEQEAIVQTGPRPIMHYKFSCECNAFMIITDIKRLQMNIESVQAICPKCGKVMSQVGEPVTIKYSE